MNKGSHILLVINPIAGHNDKHHIVEMVKREVERNNGTIDTYRTTGFEDMSSIQDLIRKTTPQRMVVVGGDGTISLVAEAIIGSNIPLGIIPAGSANGLCHSLEIPDDLDDQIKIALGEQLLRMDVLKVNGKSCLHIADLGINAELIRNFRNSNIRGKLGYILNAIPTLIETDSPFTFKIELNGQSFVRTGIMLAIANAQSYGLGGTINPRGRIDDGKFEIIIFKSFDPIEIIKTLYDEADLDSGFAECYSTQKSIIQTQRPIPFQIDGELMEDTSRVVVEVDIKSIDIAVPTGFSDARIDKF
ncbi:MAG: diacylglycerol kinase family protein [Flavobacteriaceae bacterium]|nr:diacylglycerol kinase family protein [Flavobacteriaceae bacterium]